MTSDLVKAEFPEGWLPKAIEDAQLASKALDLARANPRAVIEASEIIARLTTQLQSERTAGFNEAREAAAKEAEAQRRIYMANVRGHMSIELADNYRFGIEACRVVESAIRAMVKP